MPQNDPWIYRIVVIGLGLIAVICAVGLTWLAGTGHDVPQGIVAFGGGAIGSLGSLLAPSPHQVGTMTGTRSEIVEVPHDNG